MINISQKQLATRGSRFWARVIDLLGSVGVLGASFTVGPIIAAIATVAVGGTVRGSTAPNSAPSTLFHSMVIVCIVLPLVLFIAYQWYLLSTRGQTIGKRAVKIRIVSVETGKNAGFLINVLLRDTVKELLGVFSFVFIFRQDRRCLHDLISGTTVVDAVSWKPGK